MIETWCCGMGFCVAIRMAILWRRNCSGMGEHYPDSVERDREEMVGKKTARGCYTAGTWISLQDQNWNDSKRTNPERRDIGPFKHSPPHSKYLKHPVCNTCSSSSREMKIEHLGKKKGLIRPTICTEQIIQRNAKNIDGGSQRFTIPMPTMECLLHLFPILQIIHGS